MEKLIELLTEHCRKHYGFKDNDDIEIDTDSVCFHLYHKGKRYFPIRIETVICKDFGFIKWLVENDKIETNNLNLKVFKSMFSNDGTVEISYEELILMLLAISDEPIDFLCEILK